MITACLPDATLSDDDSDVGPPPLKRVDSETLPEGVVPQPRSTPVIVTTTAGVTKNVFEMTDDELLMLSIDELARASELMHMQAR
jgi:hypothetical protein